MKLHILKIEKSYFKDVIEGKKKAELRKNDRKFEVGDLIHFVDIYGEEYFWSKNIFRITHILKDVSEYGLDKDYVILSIEELR